MTKSFKHLIFFAFLFLCSTGVKAQESSPSSEGANFAAAATKKTIVIGGKVVLFMAKETAKAGWQTTKFAAKDVAAPLVKTIVVKAAPKVSLILVKRGTPIAAKIIVTYLKL